MTMRDAKHRRIPSVATVVVAVFGFILTFAARSEASVATWGTSGSGPGQSELLVGGVADATGNVFLLDWNNYRVQQFSASGVFEGGFGSYGGVGGGGSSTFGYPQSIALGPDGNIYVLDQSTVKVFTPAGVPVRQWTGVASVGPGHLYRPQSLAVSSSGNVYIVDMDSASSTCAVDEFDLTGTFVRSWGSCGSGDSQFTITPTLGGHGIAISPTGDVYVADEGAQRIEHFSATGTFLGAWGSAGSAPGQFAMRRDLTSNNLAVDGNSNVYVSDIDNARIQKFNSSGTFAGQYALGAGWQAASIAVDPSGTVYGFSWGYQVTRIEQVPIAGVTASAGNALSGQAITFDASHSSQPFGHITDYRWDLAGDGEYSTDTGSSPTVSHAFVTPGTTTVSVEITSSNGLGATASISIGIIPAPPVAVITAPPDGELLDKGAPASTTFSCSDGTGGPGIVACSDSNGAGPSAGKLDTSHYGPHTYTVTAVSGDGQRATQSITYVVATPASPAGNVGMSINNGDYATNNPHVGLDFIWPRGATQVLISHDGGFGPSGGTHTEDVSPVLPWTLNQTGRDRLPKTVYVRYLGGGVDLNNFTDDIILDETPPAIQAVSVAAPVTADLRSSARVANRGRPKLHRYRLKLRASDAIAGVCKVESSRSRRAGTTTSISNCRRRGITRVARTVVVKTAFRPRYVRVRNSAGSRSRWLKVR